MDMTWLIIFKKKIDINFWPKFILAMIYIKNNQPT